MFRINIYTMTDIRGPRRRDGFYSYIAEMPTEKGPATWGIYPKEIKDATENRAELKALTEALETIRQASELDIYTECAHIGTALEKGWLKEWRDNGWKNAKGKEISNRDLWQKMAELLNGNRCRIHTGEHHSFTNTMKFELEKKRKEEKRRKERSREDRDER